MKNKLLSLLLATALMCFLPVSAPAEEFFPKLQNHWAKEDFSRYIDIAHITATESRIALCPDYVATRGEMIQMIAEARGTGASEEYRFVAPFEDVELDTEYCEAIQWAKEWGIVVGNPSGKFEPNRPITREEIVTILFRLRQKEYPGEENTGTEAQISRFKDAAQISSYAKEAMIWAVGHSAVITGRPGNILAPYATATRAEAAVMLKRYLNGNAVQQAIAKSEKILYRKGSEASEFQLEEDEAIPVYRTFLGNWEKLPDYVGEPEESFTFVGSKHVKISFLRKQESSLILFVSDPEYPNLNGIYRTSLASLVIPAA